MNIVKYIGARDRELVQIDFGPQGWTHFNIFITKFSLPRRTPLIKTPAPPPSMSMIRDDYSEDLNTDNLNTGNI